SPDDVLAMEAEGLTTSKEVKAYQDLVKGLEKSAGSESVTEADRRIAAMLAGRDNLSLAKTLSPLVGDTVAQKLFGVGVLGMALSTIIILMLINGFAFCELIDVPAEGTMHRIGSFIPAVGVFGPFVWGAAAPALALPTSVIGGAMLPIAYVSFFLLMNSKSALGDSKPKGVQALVWNVLMGVATLAASFASVWGLSSKGIAGYIGLAIVSIMLLLGVIGFAQKSQTSHS
ncbi:MAG: divalent metal cation transporter, partial [Planctomycetota bacterium]